MAAVPLGPVKNHDSIAPGSAGKSRWILFAWAFNQDLHPLANERLVTA
jgi:hypothetical protein